MKVLEIDGNLVNYISKKENNIIMKLKKNLIKIDEFLHNILT